MVFSQAVENNNETNGKDFCPGGREEVATRNVAQHI